jgi:hypothetical protein
MTPSEAKRLKKRLQEQYQRDVEAIDRVLELSLRKKRNGNGNDSPRYLPIARPVGAELAVNHLVQDAPTQTAQENFGHANSEFEDMIYTIIQLRFEEEFKIKDVMEAVGAAKPELANRRSTVSFALSGLVARGKAVVIQQGRGRRPGIYRLV